VALGLLCVLVSSAHAQSAPDQLSSRNDRPAKQAIVNFVASTTTAGNPGFVAPGARFATFDQDGTLWVEQPMYAQLAFAFFRVAALAPQHPEWKDDIGQTDVGLQSIRHGRRDGGSALRQGG